MRLYIYGLLEQTRGLEELQKCLKRDQAGAKALSWLLKTAKHESLDATYSFKFIQVSALCIVGEDKTDVWWDFLTIDHAPKSLNDRAVSDLVYSRMRWQNALVVALFEAQLFWTKSDSCFDGPLQSIARITNRISGKTLSEDRIAIVAGTSWLLSRMIFFNKSNTNVNDYDAFVDFLKGYYQDDLDGPYNVGLLELMHPTDQRADTLLNFLRDAEDSEEGTLYLMARAEVRLRLVFRYLTYYCHRMGRAADARWAIDFFEEIQRKMQRLNAQGVSSRDLLHRTRRKASRSELIGDVEVNPDGHVVSKYSFTETWEQAQKREKKVGSKAPSPLEPPLHSSRAAADTTSEQKQAPVREGSVTYRPYH